MHRAHYALPARKIKRGRMPTIQQLVRNGRKPKKEAVEEWLLAHPDGTKAECHRETGIDPKTIRKWWNDKAYAEYMVEKEMEEYRKSLWWNDGQEGVDQAGHREMFEIKYGLRENPCKC